MQRACLMLNAYIWDMCRVDNAACRNLNIYDLLKPRSVQSNTIDIILFYNIRILSWEYFHYLNWWRGLIIIKNSNSNVATHLKHHEADTCWGWYVCSGPMTDEGDSDVPPPLVSVTAGQSGLLIHACLSPCPNSALVCVQWCEWQPQLSLGPS